MTLTDSYWYMFYFLGNLKILSIDTFWMIIYWCIISLSAAFCFCSLVFTSTEQPMVNIFLLQGSRSLDVSPGILNPHSKQLTASLHCLGTVNAVFFLKQGKPMYCSHHSASAAVYDLQIKTRQSLSWVKREYVGIEASWEVLFIALPPRCLVPNSRPHRQRTSSGVSDLLAPPTPHT